MNGENSEESYRECNLGFTGDTLQVNEIVKEEWVIEKQRIKPWQSYLENLWDKKKKKEQWDKKFEE